MGLSIAGNPELVYMQVDIFLLPIFLIVFDTTQYLVRCKPRSWSGLHLTRFIAAEKTYISFAYLIFENALGSKAWLGYKIALTEFRGA